MDFKGFGGITELFQQASKIREEVKRVQDSMGLKTVEASSGGGMVKVVANGKQEIVSIELDPEMMKMGDKQMLQDLVKAGVNQAIKASQEMVAEEMKKLTGGLGLGSLMSMFKGS